MASQLTKDIFGKVDVMDAAGFSQFFADDARMVFGNGDVMEGPAAIEAGVSGFFTMIKGLKHTVVNEWVQGSETILELSVAYDRLDGGNVAVPVVTIFTRQDDGLITDYRVFFDLAPVFAPAVAV